MGVVAKIRALRAQLNLQPHHTKNPRSAPVVTEFILENMHAWQQLMFINSLIINNKAGTMPWTSQHSIWFSILLKRKPLLAAYGRRLDTPLIIDNNYQKAIFSIHPLGITNLYIDKYVVIKSMLCYCGLPKLRVVWTMIMMLYMYMLSAISGTLIIWGIFALCLSNLIGEPCIL